MVMGIKIRGDMERSTHSFHPVGGLYAIVEAFVYVFQCSSMRLVLVYQAHYRRIAASISSGHAVGTKSSRDRG